MILCRRVMAEAAVCVFAATEPRGNRCLIAAKERWRFVRLVALQLLGAPRCRSQLSESCQASARAQDASRPMSPANAKAVCGRRASRAGRRRLLCVSARRNGSAEGPRERCGMDFLSTPSGRLQRKRCKEMRRETPIDRLDERGLKARRVRLQKARRKRWAARTKDPALWHAVSYTPTHCWEA